MASVRDVAATLAKLTLLLLVTNAFTRVGMYHEDVFGSRTVCASALTVYR